MRENMEYFCSPFSTNLLYSTFSFNQVVEIFNLILINVFNSLFLLLCYFGDNFCPDAEAQMLRFPSLPLSFYILLLK